MTYSVYVFLDNLDRPYYVGKTNDFKRRKGEHLRAIRTMDPLPKYNAARKLIRQGHKFKMCILLKTHNEEHAFRLEREYIKKFKKQGYRLFNCTAGGPYEKPIKINKPKKPNYKSIKLSTINKRHIRRKKSYNNKQIKKLEKAILRLTKNKRKK